MSKLDDSNRRFCQECGRSFASASKLARHRKDKHAPPSFHCPVCSRSFARKQNYLSHINNPKIHKICPYCGRSDFSTTQELSDHKRSEHGSISHIINENQSFRSVLKRSKHSFRGEELKELPEQDAPAPDETALSHYPLEYRNLISENWNWLKTRYRRKSVTATFSLRFPEGEMSVESVAEFLRSIHSIQRDSYKLQIQWGFVYRIALSYADPTESEEFTDPMYFIPQKPTAANPSFIPEPWTVACSEHLEDLIQRLEETDILEHLHLRRPSTKYIIDLVTNVMVYVYQLNKVLIGCCQETLPRYLMEKKSVRTLFYKNGRKQRWTEPQCIFRCIAASRLLGLAKVDASIRNDVVAPMNQLERCTKELFRNYCKRNALSSSQFDGAVSLNDLTSVEKTFNVGVFVYELIPRAESPPNNWKETASNSDLCALLLRKPSKSTHGEKLYLDLCNDHFSLIVNISVYASTFICGVDGCRRLFGSRKLCQQHQERCSRMKLRKVRCTGGGYEPSPTLFEELDWVGITVPSEHRIMDCFSTYDTEAITKPISSEAQVHGESTRHEAELLLASISVCSSVPGYREPRFFLCRNNNPQELVNSCVEYLLEIRDRASTLLLQRFQGALRKLNQMAVTECDDKYRAHLENLEQKLKLRITQLHVFGWNSRGFDVPICREYLLKVFSNKCMKVEKILKKANSYLLLSTDELKFLDMQALISPHASYSDWLKSLEISGAAKSFFPFSWFTDLEKLRETELPPREMWTNELKNAPLEDSQWIEIRDVWKKESMRTMEDFLRYYNNKDVTHFVDGVEKQQLFWKERGICMITEAVSLSGLSLRLFNKYLPSDVYLALPQKSDYEYIRLLRKSICGGLAQIFHRLHIAGVTKIRGGELLCRSIQGFDFNSLYLTELGMPMPIMVPIEWKPFLNEYDELVYIRRFVLPSSVSLSELEYLSYESWRRNSRIKHYLSSKQQFRIGESKYRADGFLPPNLAFEFHGCHYHSHQFEDPSCPYTPMGKSEDEVEQRCAETKDKLDYMRSKGFAVLEMTSCKWDELKRTNPEIQKYLASRFYPWGFKGLKKELSIKEIISAIKQNRIFGLCLVDIKTPEHLKEKFEIMQPLILNRLDAKEDLGPLMEAYCTASDTMRKPRRILGQAYSATNLLLITPLLNWYLANGLKITKLHWIRQFKASRVFQPIVEEVIRCRTLADKDPAMSLQGTCMKLTGNSIYGKTLESGANYTDIKLQNETQMMRSVEKPSFRSSTPVTEELFEVESARAQYSEDKPLIIGFFILQYSKMRMLKFIYEFLDKFIDRNQWQSMLMDTDSLYIALASSNMDELVSPEKRQEYEMAKKRFMITTPDQKRSPGLMKLEWKGDGLIALAPKSYICFNKNDPSQNKRSHKGVQRSNNLTVKNYYNVLRTQQKCKVINKGLWFKNGRFVKYSQRKSGLPFLITKMRTLDDGITLKPLPEPLSGINAMLDDSDAEEQ